MRILICGDRAWTNVQSIIDQLRLVTNHPIHPSDITVIDGVAHGADSIGNAAAIGMSFQTERFPANWKEFGRAAGPIRNKRMLEEGKPDLVLAFHSDISKSKGTLDMIKQANKAGIEVRLFAK